jgi:uncharacterized coiled-coil protein SlyX
MPEDFTHVMLGMTDVLDGLHSAYARAHQRITALEAELTARDTEIDRLRDHLAHAQARLDAVIAVVDSLVRDRQS